MLIVRIWEGLGNQMFQYAYARKRMEEGVPVRLDLRKAYIEAFPTLKNNALRDNVISKYNITVPEIEVEEYGKYFYLRQKTALEKKICFLAEKGLWPYPFIEEEKELYSKKIAHVKGNVYIKGWFQDRRYFEEIRGTLLREFTPKEKIRISGEIYKFIKSDYSVAIHVRRGDYVKLGRTMPGAYYLRAKSALENKIDNPVFYIFSDDFVWVKKNIDWGDSSKVFYIDELCELEDYEQLLLMSKCRAQIISNSTFSWWAAWLNTHNDKIVAIPKKFVQLNPGLEIKGNILI